METDRLDQEALDEARCCPVETSQPVWARPGHRCHRGSLETSEVNDDPEPIL